MENAVAVFVAELLQNEKYHARCIDRAARDNENNEAGRERESHPFESEDNSPAREEIGAVGYNPEFFHIDCGENYADNRSDADYREGNPGDRRIDTADTRERDRREGARDKAVNIAVVYDPHYYLALEGFARIKPVIDTRNAIDDYHRQAVNYARENARDIMMPARSADANNQHNQPVNRADNMGNHIHFFFAVGVARELMLYLHAVTSFRFK